MRHAIVNLIVQSPPQRCAYCRRWMGAGQQREAGTFDRDGERTYMIAGHYVKDSTLGGDLQITLVNGVATLP